MDKRRVGEAAGRQIGRVGKMDGWLHGSNVGVIWILDLYCINLKESNAIVRPMWKQNTWPIYIYLPPARDTHHTCLQETHIMQIYKRHISHIIHIYKRHTSHRSTRDTHHTDLQETHIIQIYKRHTPYRTKRDKHHTDLQDAHHSDIQEAHIIQIYKRHTSYRSTSCRLFSFHRVYASAHVWKVLLTSTESERINCTAVTQQWTARVHQQSPLKAY